MLKTETFTPKFEIVKVTYVTDSGTVTTQYNLFVDGVFQWTYDTRDELMAALEVMLQGVID